MKQPPGVAGEHRLLLRFRQAGFLYFEDGRVEIEQREIGAEQDALDGDVVDQLIEGAEMVRLNSRLAPAIGLLAGLFINVPALADVVPECEGVIAIVNATRQEYRTLTKVWISQQTYLSQTPNNPNSKQWLHEAQGSGITGARVPIAVRAGT